MDLFDDIIESIGIDTKYPLLHLLEKNLPKGIFEIISKNGNRISSNQDSFVDAVFEKILWEKSKKYNDLIHRETINNSLVYAWYIENIECLLVCSFYEADLGSVKESIQNIVTLCTDIFHKDQLLLKEKESLAIHKKQRDRKIQVLEKKYEDILIENQQQSAEYSKLLHSEIERQTGELKNSNKALKLAKKKAEAANLAKDAFLANMSHEIRTPMNSVLGFLELSLEDPIVHGDLQQNLSIAYNSAQGLLSLIDAILDVSKLERQKVVLEKKPFRLLDLIKKTIDTMTLEAQKKGLFLNYTIHPSTSKNLSGDYFRINQVMINLIGNAIKFTESGGVTLEVIPDKNKDELHFTIKDTGIGIPADRLEKLFDPFEQADMSSTRKYGGTGLGTAISKQLVELMGGRIWAESEKEKGSIFHFVIKIESIDDSEIEDLDLCGEPKKSDQKLDRSFKILLAEDIDENAILVKTRLEHQGHRITRVRNGQEAVDAFKKDLFDIILMDIHMPGMDGLEATTKIRSIENKKTDPIPIIALTASIMGNEIKSFIAEGMNSVVGKPIDFKHLNRVMDKLVPENKGVRILNEDSPDAFCSSQLANIKGVDFNAGMARWQNQEIYLKALINFSNQYENFSQKFLFWLDADEIEEAHQAIHALKGVAGNLSIIKVADIAQNIISALKKENIEIAGEHFKILDAELRSVILSIHQSGHQNETTFFLKTIDPDRLNWLIQKITDGFNQYSPDALKPFIQELQTYVHPERLKRMLNYSDDLDYDKAKTELKKLVKLLPLDRGGSDDVK